jgi:hypothetical protein
MRFRARNVSSSGVGSGIMSIATTTTTDAGII